MDADRNNVCFGNALCSVAFFIFDIFMIWPILSTVDDEIRLTYSDSFSLFINPIVGNQVLHRNEHPLFDRPDDLKYNIWDLGQSVPFGTGTHIIGR